MGRKIDNNRKIKDVHFLASPCNQPSQVNSRKMPTKADLESQRFVQKQRSFRGKAKVRITKLKFDDERISCQPLRPDNVSRLVKIFSLEGCFRLDPEHHVPCLISEHILNTSLHNSGLNPEDLLEPGEPPSLNLGEHSLLCLHGRHRIEAAKQFLEPFEEWWIVDLYEESMPSTTHMNLNY